MEAETGWGSGTYDDERREESVRRSWKIMSRGPRQVSVQMTSNQAGIQERIAGIREHLTGKNQKSKYNTTVLSTKAVKTNWRK